jgi:hypothetical protein
VRATGATWRRMLVAAPSSPTPSPR